MGAEEAQQMEAIMGSAVESPSRRSTQQNGEEAVDNSSQSRIIPWALLMVLFGGIFVAYANTSLVGSKFSLPGDSTGGQGRGDDSGTSSSIEETKSRSSASAALDVTAQDSGARLAGGDGVDFIIAGFPKCGTSTLVYAFQDNNETDMPKSEYCDLNRKDKTHHEAIDKLRIMIKEQYTPASKTGERPVRGFKCPNSVRFIKSLQRLERVNPDAGVVIGIRHPVLFFQSYYNYRVLSHNKEKKKYKDEIVPHPNALIGGHDKVWRGVFTGMARYELSLMQMGKVELSSEDLKELADEGLMLGPTSLRVFIYDVEQFADPDEDRGSRFRADLQYFLRLKKPLAPLGHRNVNAKQGTYAETINICDSEFDELRGLLIKHSEKTRHWIRDKFIHSEDVVVGGDKKYFLELLSKWEEDPCSTSKPERRRL